RTPGYPFFLAIFQGLLKLSINGVLLIQILLTLLVALITYRAAYQIDHEIAFLSAVIILFDPAVSIFSLMLLSETLLLFLVSLFMLVFIMYLKNNKINFVIVSALLLIMTAFVRPITYYLGIAVSIFIIYANLRLKNIKKGIIHALVFCVLVYSFFGIWEFRNYRRTGQRAFSSAVQGIPNAFGLTSGFTKNKDPRPLKEGPVAYYMNTASRCFLSLMTRPGPFKYFNSSVISVIGRIFAYPWMIFWMLGFIIGIFKIRGNIYYQFVLMLIAYFIFASIFGVGLMVSERFRVPMFSLIAVISALGWVKIKNYLSRND
ncbi:MAG: glycosyltransferase family 39 protein, partial [Candidatus Omnitrophica bacterium]|nr:glycosyltransferase family 39 protein [Candidatus Omnitrophota bacterium]